MASHIVVLDSSARRTTIRTTPDKHLADILHEACQKLGRNAESFGLKLAGLSSGAKLDLVFSSRSPSVVSVALQLPQPDYQGSTRLTEKFASNTTLWMVLRKFESDADGTKRNFTGRGVPVQNGRGSGSGRLYFETPVIQIMGRKLSSFTDLQKTLAQLGYNSGSTLLRLTFERTDTPLEEAMSEIGQYFGEIEGQGTGGAHGNSAAKAESRPETSEPVLAPDIADAPSPPEPPSPAVQSPSEDPSSAQEHLALDASDASSRESEGAIQRPVTVFAPPSSSTPKAAQVAFNEKDYEPTIDHAKLHQSRLAATGTNKRLLSDAELAAQAEAQARRNANVKEVEIKVRFPDQTQAVSKFSNLDTAKSLYGFVQGLMIRENEPFSLRFSSVTGPKSVPSGPQGNVKLISELGMVGRVLVNVVWEEGASAEARGSNVLKEQYRQKMQEIAVKEIEGTSAEEEVQPPAKNTGREDKEKKAGVPKWLKLPGKK
ncbi:MAG: hypothetical protein Q9217_005598 [Psora testacea]